MEFAFSLYDNLRKSFSFVVIDGIKPVYYHITNDKTFIYGSEIKSILEYKDYKVKLIKKLYRILYFPNIFTNKTLNKNIHILEAGFEIDLQTKILKKEILGFWF